MINTYSNSEINDDVYKLLRLIHNMAGKNAVSEQDGWCIKSCATSSNYVETTYTNNIVDIKAETVNGVHVYSITTCF